MLGRGLDVWEAVQDFNDWYNEKDAPKAIRPQNASGLLVAGALPTLDIILSHKNSQSAHAKAKPAGPPPTITTS